MKKSILFFFIFQLVFLSCNKTDEDIPDLGYDYFPLITGNYIVYTVTERTYDEFNNTDSTEVYLLKEHVRESFEDAEGRIAYKLNRYRKPNVDSIKTWKLIDVWTTYRGNNHAEKVEENVTLVKLSFPLKRNGTWDGNSRNDSAKQIYSVLNINFKTKIGGVTFGNTSRIKQKENINLIEDQFAEEVYAKNIGLIWKTNRDVSINPNDSILGGFDHQWVYKEHGTE